MLVKKRALHDNVNYKNVALRLFFRNILVRQPYNKTTEYEEIVTIDQLYNKSNVEIESDALVKFVAKEYLKIKSWKKSPKNYEVFDDNGLVIIQREKRHDYNNHKGNLAELYNNLSQLKENRYTDDYTRSYDIRIGEVYKIREEDIDVNKHGSCGGALKTCGAILGN